MEWYWWIIVLVGVICIFNYYKTKARRERLIKKYGDKNLVEKLMKRSFWQGQTEGQLIDSLGKPLDIDQKVMKTKTKEVWKYKETGKNRYALKIILENGKVVGWDQK